MNINDGDYSPTEEYDKMIQQKYVANILNEEYQDAIIQENWIINK